MGTSLLKQLAYGVVESGDAGVYTEATAMDLIRRPFDIEFTPNTKAHEYNYEKGGFWDDKRVAGADSDFFTSSFESELTFKTYLHGYKMPSKTTQIEAATTAGAENFLVTSFRHLLGGYISNNDASSRDQGDSPTAWAGTTVTSAAHSIVNADAGTAIMFDNLEAGGAEDNLLRWIIDPKLGGGDFTVNRDPKGTFASMDNLWYTTNCWGRDSVQEINSGTNQWMYFEYKRDSSEAVYKLFGCRPSMAVISSESNELPTVEWTFKVSHFELDQAGSTYFSSGPFVDPKNTEHEVNADDPYPAIGQGIGITPTSTSLNGDSLVYTGWTLTIENTLSPKLSTNVRHGIADWVLTGRKSTLEISNYWDSEFQGIFGDQEYVDVDLQNVVPGDDDGTQNIVGYRGIVAFHMPGARIVSYPQDNDNEDQLTQTLTLEAQLNYDILETALAGISYRAKQDALGPGDSEIVVAFG